MRTKLSTCIRKRRFATEQDAQAFARDAGLALVPYQCDRCLKYHLTRRTKGKWFSRPSDVASAP
jgi:hypothetical protein